MQSAEACLPRKAKMGGPKAELFITSLTRHGGRARAERIFSGALETVLDGLGLKSHPAEEVLSIAIQNMKPRIAMAMRRVAGIVYKVPMPVSDKDGMAAAVRAIVAAARTSKGGPMSWRLATALLAAFGSQ